MVIGYAGGEACAPLPPLLAARRCRLPDQLHLLVRSVRGAAWLGRGCWDARALADHLVNSEGGRALKNMLGRPTEIPPPETAPLPVVEPVPPPQPPLLPPRPPRGDEGDMVPEIPTSDVVLEPLTSNGNRAPPGAEADVDITLTDINWY